MKLRILCLASIVFCCMGLPFAHAGDLRLSLPKETHLTPVQQLNRDGVKHLKQGHIAKAKQLFVKAYLLDPDDPFTLNNLGFVSELEGDADRALKYYQLAANTDTEALIDEASKPGLKGHSVSEAFQASNAPSFRSNRANVQAIMLLEKGRILEAESALKSALRSDANNPFLLDTLGYVMESEGDLQMASQYYSAAASLHSDERVLLTLKPKWWGKPISEVAAQSARTVSEILAKGEGTSAHVARLNLRGVSALNHNDAATAQKCFAEAYRLDPRNAFTINNIGYIAELNGDRETADMYYASARTAMEANERVTFATRSGTEGRKLGSLAETNEEDVESKLKAIQDAKRRSRTPVYLKRRDQSGAVESAPESDSIQPLPSGVQPPALPPLELPDRRQKPDQTPDPGRPLTQALPVEPRTTSPAITQPPSSSQAPDNSQPR